MKYLNEAFGEGEAARTDLQAQTRTPANHRQLKKGFEGPPEGDEDQWRGCRLRVEELGGKAEAGPDVLVPQGLNRGRRPP